MLFSVTSKCSLKIRDSVINGRRSRFAEVVDRMLGCGVIGNTTDFDSVVSGSIPDTPAKQKHIA